MSGEGNGEFGGWRMQVVSGFVALFSGVGLGMTSVQALMTN
jgi:hypothetical protein